MHAVDLDLALKSHTRSVKALMDCVHGREHPHSLPPMDEHACDLGRWLDGDGARFQQFAEYAALKTAHRRYHQALKDVVTLAGAGDLASALNRLKPRSEFAELSRALMLAFDELCKKADLKGVGRRS